MNEFQVTQKFQLMDHETGKAYPIPVKEWDLLKQQIACIKERANVWHTVGSVLLGAALTAVLNGMVGTFPPPPTGSRISIAEVINWAFFAVTFISSVLSFCFGRSHLNLQRRSAEGIVNQMHLIEGRFQKPGSEVPLPTTGRTTVYGCTIRLKHCATGKLLFSTNTAYTHAKTSGQQMIAVGDVSGEETKWLVKGAHGQPEQHGYGVAVQTSALIRLQHVQTGTNLHSHGDRPSPITSQQEVTTAGRDGVCDSNDNWRIEIEGGGDWGFQKRVRLIHANTNKALHSHVHPFANGQEVTCYNGRDENDWWVAES